MDYYNEFVKLSLMQCNDEDYKKSSRVREHNAASKKLLIVKRKIIESESKAVLLELMNHENERVRLNAASCCISENVFVEEAVGVLKSIIQTTNDRSVSFAAKMLIS